MSTREYGMPQSMRNVSPQTIFFVRAIGMLLICATTAVTIAQIFGTFDPMSYRFGIWIMTVLATLSFGLSLIATSMISPKAIGKYGFLVALVFLIISVVMTTQALKIEQFPFFAEFPVYIDFATISRTTNALLKVQWIITFYVVPILMGIFLIISGSTIRQVSLLRYWKNIPLLLGVWLIISVLLASLTYATIPQTIIGINLGSFLFTLPESILLVLLGIGLWQIKVSK